MAKRRPTEPSSSESEDAKAFRAAVADVKPLQHTARVVAGAAHAGGAHGSATTRPELRARRQRAMAAAEDLDTVMPLIAVAEDGSPASSPVSGDAVLAFQRAGVRIQEMRKLRRGLIPADAELDLHGLTQAAARDSLERFLIATRDARIRCVRIIHGKGSRSAGRGAVLKTAVDAWLRRHSDVLAFTSAKPIDGGTGALYVLLRA
jgi:DNA-nicking Smr family endonuclease